MKTLKHSLILTIGILSFSGLGLQAGEDTLKPEFVDTLVAPYLQIQTALAGDDLSAAKNGADGYIKALESRQDDTSSKETNELRSPATQIAKANNIQTARSAFLDLSEDLVSLIRKAGTSANQPLFLAHCPMAFDGKGGEWIQSNKTVSNPYYGSMMLRCGGIREQIAPSGDRAHADHMHGAQKADHDQLSREHLNAVHAGVPGYHMNKHSSGASATDKESSGGCGMACCAKKD